MFFGKKRTMEVAAGKSGCSCLRNILVRGLLFSVLIVAVRFAYVVTITGESCNVGNFCFFSFPENFNIVVGTGGGASGLVVNRAVRSNSPEPTLPDLYRTKAWIKAVQFYSSVFQDLMAEGYLSSASNSLCLDTPNGQEVYALREIGVFDSIGTFKKASKPLVIKGETNRIPFYDNTFDFIFSGGGCMDKLSRPLDFSSEIARTLKPEGFAVIHVKAKDTYSLNSFINLFNCCTIVKTLDIDGFASSMPFIRQIIIQKKNGILPFHAVQKSHDSSDNKCFVPGYTQHLVRKAEPLILEEPLKPWITLKTNIKKVKYLPAMADISFKSRYIYIDVGARSYGSSIGSWFKKQYPKQNKTFEVYAIEADKVFHEEYRTKKGITLLPFAAWVRNETLSFEINRDPGQEVQVKGRGMGRIQPVRPMGKFDGEVDVIQGFDFADWVKKTVVNTDFVVMKMDIEGTEFDLIPRLFESGAICLIDEIFLECHYNRWQRCCPGQRSQKYEKTYGECLELFSSLRQSGVLVHQWW